MRYHDLKTLPIYFQAIAARTKTFEIRLNDRGFQAGDTLQLREWDGECFSGRVEVRYVSYVLHDFEGLAPGYVAMSLL